MLLSSLRNGAISTHRVCVAPMMDWTDRHCRVFHRGLTRRALLYTEMITAAAIRHGDRDRLLAFSAVEHPVALQLGGADADDMAHAAEAAEVFGYDEVNINVGCPSDRVQSGRFGACLMAEPATVASCVAAMRRACGLPVTVKTRIGIDDRDSYAALRRFVETVAAAGCGTFIIHARKAWLSGLSPKQNREVPPLEYDRVYRLKRDLPGLEIVLNGGVQSLDEVEAHLAQVDGVMLGRAAYQNPYVLAEVDRRFFDPAAPVPGRDDAVLALLPYVDAERERGTPLAAITRHILGLYQGLPGARAWRRHLSENAHRAGAGSEVIREALGLVRRAREQAADRAAA
ncbi:MAG: tRNA dihydrouridine(20/20a) synthase DusA [Inquilinus sp.]|nr:tRNA dihydrouridine(20/20a) synthase DusA [Inquilinus sp.]